MKKIMFYLLLVVTVFTILLSGCANKSTTLQFRNYSFENSNEAFKPSVTLQENSNFIFICSLLSSYLAIGSYTIENDNLTLKTEDGEYYYVFEIKGETLIFNAEKSSDLPSFTVVPNGAIFK